MRKSFSVGIATVSRQGGDATGWMIAEMDLTRTSVTRCPVILARSSPARVGSVLTPGGGVMESLTVMTGLMRR